MHTFYSDEISYNVLLTLLGEFKWLFFVFLIFVGFFVAIFDLLHGVAPIFYLLYKLHLEIFSEISAVGLPVKQQFAFYEHYSYFRNDF